MDEDSIQLENLLNTTQELQEAVDFIEDLEKGELFDSLAEKRSNSSEGRSSRKAHAGPEGGIGAIAENVGGVGGGQDEEDGEDEDDGAVGNNGDDDGDVNRNVIRGVGGGKDMKQLRELYKSGIGLGKSMVGRDSVQREVVVIHESPGMDPEKVGSFVPFSGFAPGPRPSGKMKDSVWAKDGEDNFHETARKVTLQLRRPVEGAIGGSIGVGGGEDQLVAGGELSLGPGQQPQQANNIPMKKISFVAGGRRISYQEVGVGGGGDQLVAGGELSLGPGQQPQQANNIPINKISFGAGGRRISYQEDQKISSQKTPKKTSQNNSEKICQNNSKKISQKTSSFKTSTYQNTQAENIPTSKKQQNFQMNPSTQDPSHAFQFNPDITFHGKQQAVGGGGQGGAVGRRGGHGGGGISATTGSGGGFPGKSLLKAQSTPIPTRSKFYRESPETYVTVTCSAVTYANR